MEDCNATAIMEMGSALSDPLSVAPPAEGHSLPFIAIPEGYELKDLERLFPVPNRASGRTVLRDMASFIAFVQENDNEQTRIYGQKNPPKFKAVFNDQHTTSPGWADHIATYDCPLSIEWTTWTGGNGKQMNQADFARFIEDNAPDIATPPAADMIEISRSLEAKKKVNFASAVRLDNGKTEFTYEEDIEGTAAKGRLQVPQVFTIGIPVLEGGPKYAVEARLRYRIADKGVLVLWYDLVRPHKIVEDAANEVGDAIHTALDRKIYNSSI